MKLNKVLEVLEVLNERIKESDLDWSRDGSHYIIYPTGKFESAGRGHDQTFELIGSDLLDSAKEKDLDAIKKETYKYFSVLDDGDLDDIEELKSFADAYTCFYYGYIAITTSSKNSGKKFQASVVYLKGRTAVRAMKKAKEFFAFLVDNYGKQFGNFEMWLQMSGHPDGGKEKKIHVMNFI